VSISSTFYAPVFRQKFFAQLLSSLFWLCIFWQKDIGEKSAQKMLMKLTTGVNQFHQNSTLAFFHLSVLHSFSLITVWLCNFLVKE